MPKRLLAVSGAVALVALTGCSNSASRASEPARTALDPVTEDSTCVEWAQATLAQQKEYARLTAPGIEIPARYKEGEVAAAYTFGLIAGRCHQAETTGTEGQVTLRTLLAAPSPSSTTAEAPPADDFLKPLPAVTIGNEQDGRWNVMLDNSIRSAQPLSGSAATGPTDRLLELRVTVTYLTPGPPAEIGRPEEEFQLDELPSDLGLVAHVPRPEEENAETPESKAVDCGQAQIKNLCAVIGGGTETWELYAEENEAPGGAVLPSELPFVEPQQSETFWLVGHLSEHVQPNHIVFAIEGKPLSVMPRT
jgi:hypothetical protein